MAYSLRVEPARDEDFPRMMEILVPAFQAFSFNQLTGEIDTVEGRAAAAEHHLRTKHEHEEKYPSCAFSIKCVHINNKTGEETIISSVHCGIYDRERTEAEYKTHAYFLTADWVEDKEIRQQAKDSLEALLDARVKWMGGRPYGVLMWMATDPVFGRLGGATKCVQWFIDRCSELNIPAYLEASDAGAPVYQKLGFEIVDYVDCGGVTLPIMIRWPKNYSEDDKKPALAST
ncbi:hypothetical protein M409DRAFT_29730 [Zasmidium cellare ATCC 36951]|uniref:N-acetyltransferase domain-containing protein n=1 Tax=Zasmidium cellare ATCC 36951 TaxID=1080233 RepID=A0A6A6C0D8_ZASCE|nr:uncharacterized protein M409DRAFT_29730 [Zasmidium cellare ATCC 36951]KAF2159728.1 hypothetical protein M409DRAFT_29730 [Zasmidium cellare ATCC 36951]